MRKELRAWVFGVLLAACLLAAGLGFACAQAFATDGDGSTAGSVTTTEEEEAAAAEEAAEDDDATDATDADATAEEATEDDAAAADDASDEEDADDADAEDDASGPVALDSSDNVVNEGLASDSSFLYDATIADLAGADSYYDGQTVQVTGEVVGEAISIVGDSSHVWITLTDVEANASVTVYVSASTAEKITVFGAYGKTGDTVRVLGTFNLTCSEHDGESDIHASSLTIESVGSEHPDDLELQDFIPGIIAVSIGFVVFIIGWRVKEKMR